MNYQELVTTTDLQKAMQISRSMNLTQLLKELKEWMKKVKSNTDKRRIVLSFSYAHVGVFAKCFFPEYITETFGKHHELIFNAIPRDKRGQHI